MEALALLCTLHADGPATLQRLRRGGCADLAAVEALPAEELARLVGVSASAARRLAREAGLLRERLAPGDADALLDREEAPEAIEQAQRPSAALDANDRALIQRVLTRPRPADAPLDDRAGTLSQAEEPTEQPTEEQPTEEQPLASDLGACEEAAPSTVELEPTELESTELESTELESTELESTELESTELESSVPAASSMPSPAEAPSPAGTPLAPGTVDGLASAELAALAAAEVTTLEELASADVGTLARSTGLPFSSIARWVFLARRGGRLPEPPAPDAPFGTGLEEAEEAVQAADAEARTPDAVSAGPEAADLGAVDPGAVDPDPVQAPDAVEAAPSRDALQPSSDGFGACIFEEPAATAVEAPAPQAAACEAPAAAEHAAADQAELQQPAPEAAPQPELAQECQAEGDPATEVIWDAEPASPEPPAMEAFEAPVPITEDPTVRPPFWQVRAAWRGQQAVEGAAPPATRTAAGVPSGSRAAVVDAPVLEAAEAAEAAEVSEADSGEAPAVTPVPGVFLAEEPVALEAAAEPAAPEAPDQDDTSLGWDFVIPSRREVRGHGQDPAADQPAEGIGGPFA